MSGVEGDRAALEALYNTTEGDAWTKNECWNTDMPLDKWYGVKTDPDSGRVTRLNLGGNQLNGEISSELGNLTVLELLDLSNNQLTGEIPPELGDLNNLETLWLQDNQLNGEIPSELADTSAPRLLHLSNNRLSGRIPWSQGQTFFDNGSNAELALWGNQLEGGIPVYFKAAVEQAVLRDLYIKTDGDNWRSKDNWFDFGMPLSDWYGVALDAAGRVAGLDLSDNRLEGNVPNGFGALANLENLNLSRNYGLVGPLPLNLMNLSKLITLDISGAGLCALTILKEWLDSEMIVFHGETCEKVAAWYDEAEYEVTEEEMVKAGLVDVLTALRAQSSPSISIELSPSHSVPMDTEIIGTVTLDNLDIDNYFSVIFRADITGYRNAERRCNGDDTGEDIEIMVDESREVLTVRVFDACPSYYYSYGSYTLDMSISKADVMAPSGKVELATASTQFSMSRYLMPGEVLIPPPASGVKAWMDPDPTTFDMYVGEWHKFRFRADILLYLNDHVGVLAYGSEAGHFIALVGTTSGITVEEACRKPRDFSEHWRRAIHQPLWLAACKPGNAVIEVHHETDAVDPLYKYEFRTLIRGDNSKPVFDEGAIATRSVAENGPVGQNIGTPVRATDNDDDALTYALGGDDADLFSIESTTGQIKVRAGTILDYEMQTSYSVIVSVHDGKDANGNTDTTIDATIDVTIIIEDIDDIVPPAPDPVPSAPDPVPSAPDPVPSAPDPVPLGDMVQVSKGGGCGIASRKAVDDTSRSILLNLFLIVSILFWGILRKSAQEDRQNIPD